MQYAKLKILGVILILVTSGCSGLLSDSTSVGGETSERTAMPTAGVQTTSEPTVVNVSGGSLPYDVDQVWERVRSRFGENVSPPKVRIRAAYSTRYYPGVVIIDSSRAGVSSEVTLAHEFAHHIHLQGRPNRSSLPGSLDEGFAHAAYGEGYAMYVQRWYLEEYAPGVPGDTRLPASSPEARWAQAPYLLGFEYVEYRANMTDDVESLRHLRWPNTSEQILHPERGYEPAKSLTVDVASVNLEGRTEYVPVRNPRRLGELAVRITIWSRTNESTAKRTASGWGNDQFRTFQGPDGDGLAWVIRYDNASEARQASELFEVYGESEQRSFEPLSERSKDAAPSDRIVDSLWRADSNRSLNTIVVGNETLVVFAGPESFVANANAFGSAGNVTIRVVNRSAGNETAIGDGASGSSVGQGLGMGSRTQTGAGGMRDAFGEGRAEIASGSEVVSAGGLHGTSPRQSTPPAPPRGA